ncbi:MAG: hypothetical protein IJX99_04720 [Clostridia bacterium]|nr:hypothetical protein [Clostridia bacterium]
MNYKINGVRFDKKINCDFKEQEDIILICTLDNDSYEIHINSMQTMIEDKVKCHVKKVVRLHGGVAMTSKGPFIAEVIENESEDYELVSDGLFIQEDDKILINRALFIKTRRMMQNRPVWIFVGDSGLGKSYIASFFADGTNYSCFDTDLYQILPDVIYDNIIVIGKKYSHSIQDIEKRIFGKHESIIVSFQK